MLRLGAFIPAHSPLSRHAPSARRIWRHRAQIVYFGLRSQWRRGILTKSLSRGPHEPPLLTQTIPEHFASIVSRFGDRPAVICRSPTAAASVFPSLLPDVSIPDAKETVLSYASLDHLSNNLAHALQGLGVKKGDRVAISLGNGPEFAALTYAIFKLGAILVPLNPGFNAKQVTAALAHLSVEVLVIGAVTDLSHKPCRGRDNLALLQSLVPDLEKRGGQVEAPEIPSLRKIVLVDNTAYHPLARSALSDKSALTPFTELVHSWPTPSSSRTVMPDSPLSAEETINIQFTSGTTSQPKAAMLSHTSILNNGAFIAHRMGLVPEDVIVCPPPLFHCFGSVLGYMATATTGASILFPSPAFDPLATLRMVADHQATGLYGVATMFVAEFEALAAAIESKNDPSLTAEKVVAFPTHLKKGIAAGSSVPESLMRRLYETLGLNDLVICYGMTETSPVSCMTAPDDPFTKRTASVGRVMPHTQVKIVDPMDRTRVLSVGERGELATAGYLVMQGYWGDAAKTDEVRIAEKDSQGNETVWLYSGDEACMDADGYVEITGRIKDLIIRGGENIHPLEIENCLFQHPLISDVSVVGVPDDKYGESVGAFVIAHKGVSTGASPSQVAGTKVLTEDDVRTWVREHLSSHLVPKHVFWVSEYPKTASGKIQKFKLRDVARERLQATADQSLPVGK